MDCGEDLLGSSLVFGMPGEGTMMSGWDQKARPCKAPFWSLLLLLETLVFQVSACFLI